MKSKSFVVMLSFVMDGGIAQKPKHRIKVMYVEETYFYIYYYLYYIYLYLCFFKKKKSYLITFYGCVFNKYHDFQAKEHYKNDQKILSNIKNKSF